MIYAFLALCIAMSIFIGFTVWWLREFPVPPLVDIQNSVQPRYRPVRDHWLGPITAVSASSASFVFAPGALWPVEHKRSIERELFGVDP